MNNYELIMWDTFGVLVSEISIEANNQAEALGQGIELITQQNKYSIVGLATITDKELGEDMVSHPRACNTCDDVVFVDVPRHEWDTYVREMLTKSRSERMLMQHILPSLSPESRDVFILGMCYECQAKMYDELGDE
jgi:hypothetical protein